MSLKLLFVALAVAVQVIVAVAIPVRAAIVAQRGTAVLLHVEPIDPYDPLRGYSIALAYDIGRAPSVGDRHDAGPVFVTLAPPARAGDAWSAVAAGPAFPRAHPAGTVVIRGTIRRPDRWPFKPTATFGIESLYLDETARSVAAERLRSSRALAVVRVDADGRAVITGIR